MKQLFLFLLVFLGFNSTAQLERSGREGTLPTDRPGQTYNAVTLQAGVWQLQTAGEVGGFLNNDRGLSYDVFAIPIDLRYGITDKLEIMFSPKFSFGSTQGGTLLRVLIRTHVAFGLCKMHVISCSQ